jgi:hypothetical protein
LEASDAGEATDPKALPKEVERLREVGYARGLWDHIVVAFVWNVKQIGWNNWRNLLALYHFWYLNIIGRSSVDLDTRILLARGGYWSLGLASFCALLNMGDVLILVKFLSLHDVLEEFLSMTSYLGAWSRLDMVFNFFPIFPKYSQSCKQDMLKKIFDIGKDKDTR